MEDYYIEFDCETEPLPADELALVMPDFKPAKNLKDPAKIAEDISKKKEDWLDDAALSPLTARVLAIGVIAHGEFRYFTGNGDERHMLIEWEEFVRTRLDEHYKFVGFNSNSFDVPMLCKRALRHQVKPMVRFDWNPMRSEEFLDLKLIWNNYNRSEIKPSLKALSRFFGLGDKLMDGKDFGKTWSEDREKALRYLRDDCDKTLQIGQRMGVIPTV